MAVITIAAAATQQTNAHKLVSGEVAGPAARGLTVALVPRTKWRGLAAHRTAMGQPQMATSKLAGNEAKCG